MSVNGLPRILLAEDNLVTRHLTERMLANLDYACDSVSNGREVLQALEKNSYGFVFMDIEMPEIDGVETTRQIRANSKLKHPPRIIALTARQQEKMRIIALANGMDDFLSKPVLPEDLKRVLEGRPSIHAEGGRLALRRRLEELKEIGGGEFLVELINLFFSESQTRLVQIAAALGQKDFKELSLLFHQFQGSAVNLGASELFLTCVVGEEACEQKNGALAEGCRELAVRELAALAKLIHT